MTYLEILHDLAACHGVLTEYSSSTGETVNVSPDTLVSILGALGVEAEDEKSASRSLADYREKVRTRPLPPCVVATSGYEYIFPVHVTDGEPATVTIECENGEVLQAEQRENWTDPVTYSGRTIGEASFAVPDSCPMGYHLVRLISTDLEATCPLIVAPRRLSTADAVAEHPTTGVMAQLYSVRSHDSWGLGDFHDLGVLAETVHATAGADYLLINPLHAAQPLPPAEDSPYLPTSRRFLNPIYLRIEDIPEYAALDDELRAEVCALSDPLKVVDAAPLQRTPVYTAKLAVLRELYAVPRTPERAQAYAEFQQREGAGLHAYARWCAHQEAACDRAAHAVDEDLDEIADFYAWLQFLCDEQLAAAQKKALDAGMTIGLMTDLAVGVHPGGADAHTLADVLAPKASVGAPPDNYNQQGQDWSQPPWHPVKLAESGYAPWRDLVRSVIRNAGGIRVDHVLGLFRLFWIPRCTDPSQGTYVTYDHEAMLGVLVLEAERMGALVVGEDLGTFEPWVQEALTARGVLGTSLVWFEGSPTRPGPRQQNEYRPLSMTSIGSHDLPPCAGYLEGEHIRLREELGLLERPVELEIAEDLSWQNEVLSEVDKTGCFEGTPLHGWDFSDCARQERGATDDLLVGLHRFVAGTPAALTCTLLVDMVGDRRAQNQPGTTNDVYPNWCIPLCDIQGKAVALEDLPKHPLYRRIAQAARRGPGFPAGV